MQINIRFFLIVLFSILMIACGAKDAADKSDADKKSAKPTLVTVTQVKNQAVETSEEAIGTLEGAKMGFLGGNAYPAYLACLAGR